jgi:surface protein
MKTNKKTTLLFLIGLSSISSYSLAQNYSFRFPVEGVNSSLEIGTGSSDENEEPVNEVDIACYDSSNIGKIGNMTGCNDMLIVNNDMLHSAGGAKGYTTGTTPGNETFAINHIESGRNFTFENSEDNIFTGQVTTLNQLFAGTNFNGDINYWDTSNVKDMSILFTQTPFNQPLDNWDTSNVTNMTVMFYSSPFNYPIGNWNVSNVTNMASMFHYSSFNQPLANWDVSNVTTTNYMFTSSPFNQPIGNWDISKVNNISGMFRDTPFNHSIKDWNTSNVNAMLLTFAESSFNNDISTWDTSSVNDMYGMFQDASNFNQNLSTWCVNNITLKPDNFDVGASSWILPQPQWGTCP